jgi:hypothetical protein
MLTHYEKVAPHLNKPLYTRPVRTVVGEVLPRQLVLAGRSARLAVVIYFLTQNTKSYF